MTTLLLNSRLVEIDKGQIGFFTISPSLRCKSPARPAIKAGKLRGAFWAIAWTFFNRLPAIN